MRRRTILLLSVLAILIVAFAVARTLAQPLALPALGFVAKVVCSDVFVGGFAPEQALADLPDEPIAKLVRTRIDVAGRRVHASVPLVARREARYRDGIGCTLVSGDTTVSGALAAAALAVYEDTVTGVHVRAVGDSMARGPEDDDVDRAAIDAALDEAFSEPDGTPTRRTRAVVIVHRGRIIAERYADGFDPSTRFAGWSMTKSVTNALVGVLVGEGRLDLRASALRPEWRGAADPRRTITLDDLLRMSSGLAFDENYTPTGGATRMLFAERDAAAVAARSALEHAPGTRFWYSSGTTNIISALIRETLESDRVYIAFPRRALFDRIGMTSAVIEPDPSGTLVGSSFMYATARDWARFALLFLNDGVSAGERILPEGWVEYSVTPAPAARRGEYGAHWWLNAGAPGDSTRRLWPGLPRDVYSASGFQGQYAMVVPSRELVIVRLGVTADGSAWDMAEFAARIIAAVH
jgi:CubicO group peptidase (beta-lactamase class C family)